MVSNKHIMEYLHKNIPFKDWGLERKICDLNRRMDRLSMKLEDIKSNISYNDRSIQYKLDELLEQTKDSDKEFREWLGQNDLLGNTDAFTLNLLRKAFYKEVSNG